MNNTIIQYSSNTIFNEEDFSIHLENMKNLIHDAIKSGDLTIHATDIHNYGLKNTFDLLLKLKWFNSREDEEPVFITTRRRSCTCYNKDILYNKSVDHTSANMTKDFTYELAGLFSSNRIFDDTIKDNKIPSGFDSSIDNITREQIENNAKLILESGIRYINDFGSIQKGMDTICIALTLNDYPLLNHISFQAVDKDNRDEIIERYKEIAKIELLPHLCEMIEFFLSTKKILENVKNEGE